MIIVERIKTDLERKDIPHSYEIRKKPIILTQSLYIPKKVNIKIEKKLFFKHGIRQ